VWQFYEKKDEKRACVFCEYVFILSSLISLLIYPCRRECAAGKKFRPVKYGLKTGTGTLRKHLFEHHADDWISACDTQKIPITAKEAQPILADYRARQGMSAEGVPDAHTPGQRRTYTPDGFVEAIVEWIVADDQVRSTYV
jgi:hypothetical protein